MTESYGHRFLKEIALIWLEQQGYLWLGTEIPLNWPVPKIFAGQTSLDEHNMKRLTLGGIKQTWHNRFVIDCIGLKTWYRPCEPYPLWGCGIEVKVNRKDYLSGFCFDRLNLHYVIAPKNVIPASTLPKRVGLLEVENATINEFGELQGVRIAKRPRAITLEFEQLKSLMNDMCRHISKDLALTLKAQLPEKKKPTFKEELNGIRCRGNGNDKSRS